MGGLTATAEKAFEEIHSRTDAETMEVSSFSGGTLCGETNVVVYRGVRNLVVGTSEKHCSRPDSPVGSYANLGGRWGEALNHRHCIR